MDRASAFALLLAEAISSSRLCGGGEWMAVMSSSSSSSAARWRYNLLFLLGRKRGTEGSGDAIISNGDDVGRIVSGNVVV